MAATAPMARALTLSLAARGVASMTAWVGAVVTEGAEIVGEGATAADGGLHAEARALEAAGGRGDTIFTTLEPCAPFSGKRNPPCADAIIAAGIRRVVVALEDPDSRVAGRGLAALREAGIDVEVGDGAKEARAILRPYLKHRETGLPYVIAKWASSLDGRIATASGESQWITGAEARSLVHEQRAWVDAVLAGSGTVLADDPALTARPNGETSARQPVRVVLDGRGRTSPEARVFREPGQLIVATSPKAGADWTRSIAATGAQLIVCEPDDGGVNLDQLFQTLAQRGIMSIWCEGGATVLGSLFAGGHVDEVWAFVAPMIIGGDGLAALGSLGLPALADAPRLKEVSYHQVGADMLVRGYAGGWSPKR